MNVCQVKVVTKPTAENRLVGIAKNDHCQWPEDAILSPAATFW